MANCLKYKNVYGYSLASSTPQWNGSARSADPLTGSGYYSIRDMYSSVGIVVGLARDGQKEGYSHIEFGLYFSRGVARVIENSILIGDPVSFTPDAEFHIVRAAETIYYCMSSIFYGSTDPNLPGTPFATSAVKSYGTYYLAASLYNVGDTIIAMSLNELGSTYGSSSGGLLIGGLAASAAITNTVGLFQIQGSATGRMLAGSSGSMLINGLCSNYAYAESRPTFSLSGLAYSALAPAVSGVEGYMEITGSSYGAEVFPITVLGQFRIAGKTSDRFVGEAAGQFWSFGICGGQRSAPANYFNIGLKLTDENGTDYVSRFAPINVFPSYKNEHGYFLINKEDLADVSDSDPNSDWTHVVLSMFKKVRDTYEELPAPDQPAAATPWILSSSSVTASNHGLTVTNIVEDEIEFTFILQANFSSLMEET